MFCFIISTCDCYTKKKTCRKICSVVALHRYYSSRGLWYWYANGQLESQGLDKKSGVLCGAVSCGFYNHSGYNYAHNMRGIYDVQSLNAFVEVNPATMRGQELMDAGRVQFVAGANINFNLANGFKNTDTYCVAPTCLQKMEMPAPVCPVCVYLFMRMNPCGTCFLIFPIQPRILGLQTEWWLTLVLF